MLTNTPVSLIMNSVRNDLTVAHDLNRGGQERQSNHSHSFTL
jgi:hypothetical protein